MSFRHSLLIGAEEDDIDGLPQVSAKNNMFLNNSITFSNRDGTRGGNGSLRFSANFGQVYLPTPRGIPWEDIIVEFAYYSGVTSPGNGDVIFRKNTSYAVRMHLSSNTRIYTRREGGFSIGGGTDISGSPTSIGEWQYGKAEWNFFSLHVTIDTTTGTFKVWKDGVKGTPVVDIVGDTEGQGTNDDINEILLFFNGNNASSSLMDDFWARPRCILVDAASAITGTPTIDGTVSGTTESGTVYAWESNSSDSESGSGDPDLPADTFRLFLRDVSFGPEESGATGFADGETVTVSGLSGPTISVHAPDSGIYKKGLEPGGMLFGPTYFIESPGVDTTSAGNYDSAGTLAGAGSPATRRDALDVAENLTGASAKYIEHTAANERVSVKINALTDQSDIADIHGIRVVASAVKDGTGPDNINLFVRDNATDNDGEDQNVNLTDTIISEMVTLANSGTAGWTAGTGAGGLEDAEIGYRTRT